MINAMFNEYSWIMKLKCIIFTLGFFLPFVIQIFVTLPVGSVIATNFVCLLISLLFLIFEFLQLRYDGWRDYFSHYWNKIDLGLFISYIIYFIFRLIDPAKSTLPNKNLDKSPAMSFLWIAFNAYILLFSFIKCFSFLRFENQFGTLVELVV